MPIRNIEILSATADDAEAISELIQSLSDQFIVDYDAAWAFKDSISAQSELSYLSSPRYRYHKLIENEKLIGFIAMRDATHVFHFFVANQYQGRGFGSQLWQFMLDQLPSNCKSLTVNASVNAVPIYQKYGFEASSTLQEAHGIRYLPMILRLV